MLRTGETGGLLLNPPDRRLRALAINLERLLPLGEAGAMGDVNEAPRGGRSATMSDLRDAGASTNVTPRS